MTLGSEGRPAIDARRSGLVRCRAMVQRIDASDGDLARAVSGGQAGLAGDAEAELYRRFAPRVRLFGLRHLRDEDEARDLVQQVLLLTIEKLRSGGIREVDQIASFILGTSRTMAIDLKRRERRRQRIREAILAGPAVTAAESHAALDGDRLEACLGRLAERERMIVLLTFYAERTAKQVADEMLLTEGNVRVVRHRAIGKLRACLTATGDQR